MVDPTNHSQHSGPETDSRLAAEVSILTGLSEAFGLDGGGVDLPAGADLGGVTIVRLLAEGGMGRVYEGRQLAPLRPVAVKVLRDGLASASRLRQFAQEAELLARLKHPNIAQVHMLGTFPHGNVTVPFFVLELVDEALPIDRFARERQLSIRQRVILFRRAVAAVAHGHRLGVVHRDLKPGNILVGGDGEPKVIDFGIARCTDADLALTTLHGDSGGIIGTLRYMSPEQFDADPTSIDPQTDVYALGLVLCELLTGDLPYDVRGKSLVVAARIIRDQEPQAERRIRHALAVEGAGDAAEQRTLAAIVEKCLQKRPDERYASAEELEAELGRWIDGEPVLARPLGALERWRRRLRAHRAAAVAAAVVLTVMGIATASIGIVSLQARGQRDAAERHRVAAAREAARAGVEASYAMVRRAAEARERGNIGLARSLVAEAKADPVFTPTVEMAVLSALLDDSAAIDESLAVLSGHADRVTSVAATAARPLVATGSEDGTARIWSRGESGHWTEAVSCEGHSAAIWGVAFSSDGGRLATAAADRTVCIWDAHTGRRLVTLRGHRGPVYGVVFSPDGGLVATASGDRSVRLWNAADGVLRRTLEGHGDTVFGVAFSPDGSVLASSSRDLTVRLWTVADGVPLATLAGHERRVFNVCFSPDGSRLASAAEDGTVRLWHVDSRSPVTALRHSQRVNAVAFSDDGSMLATASVDGVLRIWDSRTGRETNRLRGHADGIWSVAAMPEGRFVTGSADATARIWDVDASDEPLLRCGSAVQGVAVSPDGRLLATALTEGGVLLWDRQTLRELRRLLAGAGRVNAIAFSPDGHLLAAACHDGGVRLFHAGDGEPVNATEPLGRPVYAVVFSPDGTLLATAGDDGRVRVLDAATCVAVAGPFEHPRRTLGVAWSPDGGRLATACADGIVRLWDVARAGPPVQIDGHTGAVNWVVFSPDSARLASCSSDGTARLWDASAGTSLAVLDGPVGQVWEVAFSPDGTRLAGVGADRRLHLWDTASGRHIVGLDAHADEAWAIAFAPDGAAILTGSWDGTARLWGCSAADLHRRRAATVR